MPHIDTNYSFNTYYRPASATGPVGRVPPVEAVRPVGGRSRPAMVFPAVDQAPYPSVRQSPAASGVAVEMRMGHPDGELAEILGPHAAPAGTAAADTAVPQDAQKDIPGDGKVPESKSAAEVFEEAECQTCAERKYQDGSNDPGVSFKTATKISPEQAAYKVRGHEMEHVVRERAKAEREDREVIRQSVVLHTAICPECGRPFISGGTTTTTTQAKQPSPAEQAAKAQAQTEVN